ncbi:hypothetical protein CDAR_456301 [Caerostris darwini]|uniref:Uncharacterized protein n=1 Tax=Caerostris darwini TaxID=1538125 RepID=A0AAV4QDT7_9ARAC|nr:hypothetical protein CDAR_456301 [Caerostris darwini]
MPPHSRRIPPDDDDTWQRQRNDRCMQQQDSDTNTIQVPLAAATVRLVLSSTTVGMSCIIPDENSCLEKPGSTKEHFEQFGTGSGYGKLEFICPEHTLNDE